MTPLLIKSFPATTAIEPYRIAKATGDRKVGQAAANTDRLVGVTGQLATAIGEMADLTQVGWGELKLGGNVSFGDRLTSDAQGRGVAVASVGNTVVQTIGIAQADGVQDDIIPVLVVPGLQSKPAA